MDTLKDKNDMKSHIVCVVSKVLDFLEIIHVCLFSVPQQFKYILTSKTCLAYIQDLVLEGVGGKSRQHKGLNKQT